LIPQESKAVDEVETLIIQMKNGSENTFFLKDKPKVTFEGVNLKVSATTGDVSFALADVLRFTYDKRSTTGINEGITTPTGVAFEGDVLVISQLKANATASIYALDGKLIRQLKPHRAGTYRISLSGLPTGIYLVKADNVTYKITKR
jgi:hypothetical protein